MPSYHNVDAAPDQKPDWHLLKRLFAYIKPYRWSVDAAIACNLVVAALQALRPWLTKIAIDDYIVPKDISGLGYLCLVIVGLVLLQTVLQYILTYLMAYIGQNIIHDLRCKLMKHTMTLDQKHFDQTPVGRRSAGLPAMSIP